MIPRRMLPSDISDCIELCDMGKAIQDNGLADDVEKLIIDLMLANQFWGSVVVDDDKSQQEQQAVEAKLSSSATISVRKRRAVASSSLQ